MHPEWKHPADVAVAGDGAAVAARVWEWTGDETMHPFWAVRRLTQDQLQKEALGTQFNCSLVEKDFQVVTVGAYNGDSIAMSCTVKLSFMENTVPLPRGAELLWLAAKAKSKEAQKRETWQDDDKKKRKADAAAFATPTKEKKGATSKLEAI